MFAEIVIGEDAEIVKIVVVTATEEVGVTATETVEIETVAAGIVIVVIEIETVVEAIEIEGEIGTVVEEGIGIGTDVTNAEAEMIEMAAVVVTVTAIGAVKIILYSVYLSLNYGKTHSRTTTGMTDTSLLSARGVSYRSYDSKIR